MWLPAKIPWYGRADYRQVHPQSGSMQEFVARGIVYESSTYHSTFSLGGMFSMWLLAESYDTKEMTTVDT